MENEDLLTYTRVFDESGNDLGLVRILDVEPTVGYMITRYCTEGHIPWEITSIEENGTAFGKHRSIKATVKVHPYVKTHCDHVWNTKQSPQIITKFIRECKKCGLKEEFSYGTAKWTKTNDQ